MQLNKRLNKEVCARQRSNSTLLIWSVLLFTLVYTVSSCTTADKEQQLEVVGGKPVVYQAENGDRMTARYYSSFGTRAWILSKSRCRMGKNTRCRAFLSASGVRYTDDMELVWWNKGNTAHVEKRDENGEWQILYSECVEVPGN